MFYLILFYFSPRTFLYQSFHYVPYVLVYIFYPFDPSCFILDTFTDLFSSLPIFFLLCLSCHSTNLVYNFNYFIYQLCNFDFLRISFFPIIFPFFPSIFVKFITITLVILSNDSKIWITCQFVSIVAFSSFIFVLLFCLVSNFFSKSQILIENILIIWIIFCIPEKVIILYGK